MQRQEEEETAMEAEKEWEEKSWWSSDTKQRNVSWRIEQWTMCSGGCWGHPLEVAGTSDRSGSEEGRQQLT